LSLVLFQFKAKMLTLTLEVLEEQPDKREKTVDKMRSVARDTIQAARDEVSGSVTGP